MHLKLSTFKHTLNLVWAAIYSSVTITRVKFSTGMHFIVNTKRINLSLGNSFDYTSHLLSDLILCINSSWIEYLN